MRVVGGELRGRRLARFRGTSIRPTSDRVREAVFNVIAARVSPCGLKGVLDLFAGTGAMGIEALSRGVESAVFVDKSAGAVSVIRRNLEAFGVAARARVIKAEVKDAVRSLAKVSARFDLIFIDPPYKSSLTEQTLDEIEKAGLLRPGGLIVAEVSKRAPLEPVERGFRLLDERRYGETLIYFFGL
ncbi:MAG: 16S rRNA (guanine(966)-N(2))-methyltransferase RsmD [Thermodesulfobacteriota bacterium]|nr:MAG: 16S rRNA (guanine(966)-N(2))-methyltransferase RsmD [Thermodesulfobacteriota bacterium]